MNIFVLLYEEPTLRAHYGEQYIDFCHNVPRWIPRLIPWTPTSRR
jgi:protein-S-isoprenylcysteine O-methyltransferase Ste14